MITNKFAQNMHRIMSEMRLSASELARQLNIPVATIKKLRSGENNNPTLSTIMPIAKYLGLTLTQMIEEDMPYSNIDIVSNTYDNESIPIISWQEAILWPTTKHITHQEIKINRPGLSENSFALKTNFVIGRFCKNSFLIVDPTENFVHESYVLVVKTKQNQPSIKLLLQEDGNLYLKSETLDNELQQLDSNYKVLGVVMGYIKWLKEFKD